MKNLQKVLSMSKAKCKLKIRKGFSGSQHDNQIDKCMYTILWGFSHDI